MESFERFIQALEDIYDEKGDAKVLRLVALIRMYRSLIEKRGGDIDEAVREIGKIVADVIGNHPVGDAIRIMESKLSKLKERVPLPPPPAVNIKIPYMDMVGEDRAIVHLIISNEGRTQIRAQAIKVLDEKGSIIEMLPFEETVVAPKSMLEKSFTLRIGMYILKFNFMLNEGYEILEVERRVEVKPPTLPRLNIELLSPPNHTRLSPPLTFSVRITSAGKPVQNANVTFYIEDGRSIVKKAVKTDMDGYAEVEGEDPGWSYEAILNWWVEASKAGYEKGVSEKRIVTYVPFEEMIKWVEKTIEKVKNFIRKIGSE
ncbi:MAG: hypothetical protein FGF51_04540 [Candidatus Brockarchaeota archaeon]|nr:hypothetical protein [Candidatus Brockarchaeota archaeon]